MKQKRPVFLNLTQIRFPVTAIVSILHRISGVLAFISLPFLLWLLNLSLSSQDSYNRLYSCMTCVGMRIFIFILLAALLYHLVAGIRHLFMDIGYGDSLRGGRIGALLVVLISLVLIIGTGIWLWL